MVDPAACAASSRDPKEPGRSYDWPVEQQLVEGTRRTLMAHVENWAWILSAGALARLPRPLLSLFTALFAPIAKAIDRRHASSARVFIRQALENGGSRLSKAEVERRVTLAYRHLVEVAVTPLRLERRFGSSPSALLDRCEVVLSDDARSVMVEGGCVAVSAHIGDWEMASRIASAVGFRPFYAIGKPPRNQPVSRTLQKQREAGGIRLLPRRGAMAFAPRIIEGHGTFAMLLDQRARKKPVLADFFGRLARSDRSAGVLVKRLGCPVVFMAAYRTADLRWRFVAERVLQPEAFRGRNQEQIARLINAELERQILVDPEQYFWLHDRYRDTPKAKAEPANP